MNGFNQSQRKLKDCDQNHGKGEVEMDWSDILTKRDRTKRIKRNWELGL